MNVQILYDETSKEAHLFSGWGFSAIIGPFLFDTGEKGLPLLENMKRLQRSVYDIESVIISHNHWDHWGGLWDILQIRPKLKVYGPARSSEQFKKRVEKEGGTFVPVSEMTQLNDTVFLTDEMKGLHKGSDIFEIAMIIRTEKGISLCSGCAHPGIATIAEKAIAPFVGDPLHVVFGGFHMYQKSSEEVDTVFQELKDLGFMTIYPGHCSGSYAKKKGTKPLYTGMVMNI